MWSLLTPSQQQSSFFPSNEPIEEKGSKLGEANHNLNVEAIPVPMEVEQLFQWTQTLLLQQHIQADSQGYNETKYVGQQYTTAENTEVFLDKTVRQHILAGQTPPVQNPLHYRLLRNANALFSSIKEGSADRKDVHSPVDLVDFPVDDCQLAQKQLAETAVTFTRCRICRLEDAKVSHFGVLVCTGCRAFFRRAVSQQKIYRCLNSRLCGKFRPVPNRRVCKFCRFQRCVTAGMLKSKEEFQTQQMEDSLANVSASTLFAFSADCNPRSEKKCCKDGEMNIVASSAAEMTYSNFPLAQVNAFPVKRPRGYSLSIGGQQGNIMEQFLLCRRKIAYERMWYFYTPSEKKRSVQNSSISMNLLGMKRSIEVGWKEASLFNRFLFGLLVPFNTIKDDDRTILSLEYTYCWTMFEHLWATIRNGGHQSKRSYHVDGHFWQVSEAGARQYYGPTFDEMLKEAQPSIVQALLDIFLSVSIFFLGTARELAMASLDEEESSALALLFFTRGEVLGMISKESANTLRTIRQKTLRLLADHLYSTGQDMAQRMDQVISLVQPLQEVVHLRKSVTTLVGSAFLERMLPEDFLLLTDQAEQCLNRLNISGL